jgi:hypothetical protein
MSLNAWKQCWEQGFEPRQADPEWGLHLPVVLGAAGGTSFIISLKLQSRTKVIKAKSLS